MEEAVFRGLLPEGGETAVLVSHLHFSYQLCANVFQDSGRTDSEAGQVAIAEDAGYDQNECHARQNEKGDATSAG